MSLSKKKQETLERKSSLYRKIARDSAKRREQVKELREYTGTQLMEDLNVKK